MAFSLNSFRALAEKSDEALEINYRQIFILDISALAADVAYDLGDFSGTFWTDVDTASSPGKEALAAFKDVKVIADGFVSIASEVIEAKQKVGAAPSAATEYQVEFDGGIPELVFNAGAGPTTHRLRIEWDLKKDHKPILVEA